MASCPYFLSVESTIIFKHMGHIACTPSLGDFGSCLFHFTSGVVAVMVVTQVFLKVNLNKHWADVYEHTNHTEQQKSLEMQSQVLNSLSREEKTLPKHRVVWYF